jgi:hypothetical protein
MSINYLPEPTDRAGEAQPVSTYKYWLDFVVLQCMAKKITVTLRTTEQTVEPGVPLSYAFEERRGRQHRMLLFAPRELLKTTDIGFVGFVSKRRQHAEQHVIDDIFRADALMQAELKRIPGLLSYSSLELHPGLWYNLVLFRDESVKEHIKHSETHRHAAYDLSPSYYAWIRLHNGTLPGGLTRQKFCLTSTKHYRFSADQRLTVMHERYDDPCTRAC